METKYIRTKDNSIIVFSSALKHNQFSHFNPISAGFIAINNSECKCYGESFSLNIKSNSIDDSILANRQILRKIG
ncbi:MAG: hypothetical protein ABIP51_20100 [Bacteroidia bacterium]